MPSIDRRGFLVCTGLDLGAAVLTGECSRVPAVQPLLYGTLGRWDVIRDLRF